MIPFVDLQAQYRNIRGEIQSAIDSVLNTSQYILGKQVEEFEDQFAAYCESKYCVGVNSGTSALHLALLAAGVGPGDEVITVPFTFVATVAAVYYTGATPVYVDIDPVTFTMDPSQIEARITPRTKAILPVHLYGQMADMDAILSVARRNNLVVIEDAAQAHGARQNGKRAGSFGDLACFSFYPGKNLGAYGEGGAVVTNDERYTKTVRMLRDWGQERKYMHVLRGYNYRLEGLQGAILKVKLAHLDAGNERRRANARLYSELLAGAGVVTPNTAANNEHVFHIYAIRDEDRDGLSRTLNEAGIQTGVHYPIPVHLLPAYADLSCTKGQWPESERAAAEVLSLPMFPELTADQIETVAGAVLHTRRVVHAQ